MALKFLLHRVGSYLFHQWFVGTHGNAWNDEQTGVGGTSNIIRTFGMPFLSISGEIYADTTLSFSVSQDGVNFFFCNVITTTIEPVQPPAPAWATGIEYAVNDEVTNDAVRYRCTLAHTSNAGREPPNVTYWAVVPAGYPKQFHIYPAVGAEYVRLRSTNDVKATATIAAKRSA